VCVCVCVEEGDGGGQREGSSLVGEDRASHKREVRKLHMHSDQTNSTGGALKASGAHGRGFRRMHDSVSPRCERWSSIVGAAVLPTERTRTLPQLCSVSAVLQLHTCKRRSTRTRTSAEEI
jgi:hypothetical protein